MHSYVYATYMRMYTYIAQNGDRGKHSILSNIVLYKHNKYSSFFKGKSLTNFYSKVNALIFFEYENFGKFSFTISLHCVQ